ncbi:MAG: PD-(D/E)XK nuclease family protein [Elusimicrobia bacterium]|nr:PD-(D/E)XK nuclease family protein [Elusimicrobiota bacterium]
MFEISYTKARAYLNCPWLYKLKFIDGWKAPPSPQASLGISIHKALELFHLRRAASREELEAALEEAWERPGYQNAAQELEFYDRARDILDCYRQGILAQWLGRVRDVEKEFVLDIPAEGFAVRGTMDRLDELPGGAIALIEYKTHAEAWSPERIGSDLQMALYAHAARQMYPDVAVKPYFFFVAQGKVVEVKEPLIDWPAVLREISRLRALILERSFPPDTRYCPYCDLRRSCRYSTVKFL